MRTRHAARKTARKENARPAIREFVSSRFRRLGALAIAIGFPLVGACTKSSQDQPIPQANVAVSDAGPARAAVPLGPISVVAHHNDMKRSGTYVQPGLSQDLVSTLHVDPLFDGTLGGTFAATVHSQPLFVDNGPHGKGAFYVVSEINDVMALDETTGAVIWRKNFGTPADQESTQCTGRGFGFIGITGTPAIDLVGRTIYFDAVESADPAVDGGIRYVSRHLIHALSIDDGTEKNGWPFDPSGLTSNGHKLDPTVQHQRGALLISEGMLYVPYGSLGDCGDYHGWLVGIPIADPSTATAYAPPGTASAIWGPSGVAADQGSIFIATGNSQDPAGGWAGGEAVMRFTAGVPLPSQPDDFYAPASWHDMDLADSDLGGSGVLLIDAPASTPSELALALGKDGVAYLLDQDKLGGLASGGPEGLVKLQVATKAIVTAAATFNSGQRTFVVLDVAGSGVGLSCPPGQSGNLVALEIVGGAPPTIQTAWCANNVGHGSPMVTTTDGESDPIVWATADASKRLHGYDALTGDLLYSGGGDGDILTGLHRFNTVIAVRNRIIVAADTGLYAFTK